MRSAQYLVPNQCATKWAVLLLRLLLLLLTNTVTIVWGHGGWHPWEQHTAGAIGT